MLSWEITRIGKVPKNYKITRGTSREKQEVLRAAEAHMSKQIGELRLTSSHLHSAVCLLSVIILCLLEERFCAQLSSYVRPSVWRGAADAQQEV